MFLEIYIRKLYGRVWLIWVWVGGFGYLYIYFEGVRDRNFLGGWV